MNPIRTIGRLACTLTGLAAALAAAAAAAFAATRPYPPPGPPAEVVRFGPEAHTFNGVTGDMTGWQITLIAVGAAIAGAVVGVLLNRVPVDAKPPTPQARPRGGSHRRAATPPKSSLASADRQTCPNRTRAATALRDQFADHGAMPIARNLQRARRECVPNWRICASAGFGTGSTNACKYSAICAGLGATPLRRLSRTVITVGVLPRAVILARSPEPSPWTKPRSGQARKLIPAQAQHKQRDPGPAPPAGAAQFPGAFPGLAWPLRGPWTGL
jgi:hypothetical protein